MLDPRDDLTRRMAQTASGSPRSHVLNASGVLILNSLRQSHKRVEEAERELDDLVERMKAVLRERHYTDNGDRRVNNIVVDVPEELQAELCH